MVERIKSLLPHFVILIIIIALINIGVIPGKQRILRYLGLARQSEPEPRRPLDYVPGRLLELKPSPASEVQQSASPAPAVSTPSVKTSPTPVSFPSSSPKISEPPIPPIPPAYIYGVKSTQTNPQPPPPNLVGEVNNSPKDESILETFKNFFGGIF